MGFIEAADAGPGTAAQCRRGRRPLRHLESYSVREQVMSASLWSCGEMQQAAEDAAAEVAVFCGTAVRLAGGVDAAED